MSTALHISLQEFISRSDRDDDLREELIEGEVILSPVAKMWHAQIVDRFRDELAALKQQGYMLVNDFSCIVGGNSMPIPDLAAALQSRCDAAIEKDGWLEGAPELVIEVASPSNRKLDRKAALYLEHGAEQVWLVYRKTKTVTVITQEATSEARIGETLEFRGVRVAVSSIFQG